MEYRIEKTVKEFYDNLIEKDNHRYMSWEHCFKAFQQPKQVNDKDYLSLHLAFYLASWGMYRGSSALLWKDYKIHNRTVEIINDEKYDGIRCNNDQKIDINYIELILEAKNEISKHYKSNGISPTDTLISKILLGTLGCVPAYDRLFKKGLNNSQLNQQFNKKSLKILFNFINLPAKKHDFENIQSYINLDQESRNGCYYPIMKIVDMYFWETGRKIEEIHNNNGI